ncbi:MAG: hypothetical protein ACYTXC_13595 [Nostoc sp.]
MSISHPIIQYSDIDGLPSAVLTVSLNMASGLSQKFSEVRGVQIPDFAEVVGDLAVPQN